MLEGNIILDSIIISFKCEFRVPYSKKQAIGDNTLDRLGKEKVLREKAI